MAAVSQDRTGGDGVLMPLGEPPEWLARTVAWSLAAGTVLVAGTWFWLTSVPGELWLPVTLAFVLAAIVLAIYPTLTLTAWLRARRWSTPSRLPVAATVMAVVLVATVLATWTDLPVRARFAVNRTALDETVALVATMHDVTDADAALDARLHVDGYGPVRVQDVPGGLWVTSDSWGAGDTDRLAGFAYLPSPDAVAAWPEGHRLQGLGGDWFLTTRPVG